MRFHSLILAAVAPLCLATPAPVAELAERASDGTKVVLRSFAEIQNRTLELDAQIKLINKPDLGQQLPLPGYANAIIVALQNQTALVKAAGKIPYGCVLNVAGKAQELIDIVAKTLSDLKAIKVYTDGSGATDIVISVLQQFPDPINKFIAALRPKVPKAQQFLVTGDRRQLNLLFSNAIAFFEQPAANSTA